MDSPPNNNSEHIQQIARSAENALRQVQETYFNDDLPSTEAEFVSARSPTDTWRSTSISGVDDWCSVGSDGTTLDDFKSIDDDIAEEYFSDDSPEDKAESDVASSEPTQTETEQAEILSVESLEASKELLVSPKMATDFQPKKYSTVLTTSDDVSAKKRVSDDTRSEKADFDVVAEQRLSVSGEATSQSGGLQDIGETSMSSDSAGKSNGFQSQKYSKASTSSTEDTKVSKVYEIRTQIKAGGVEKEIVTQGKEDSSTIGFPSKRDSTMFPGSSFETIHKIKVIDEGQSKEAPQASKGVSGFKPAPKPLASKDGIMEELEGLKSKYFKKSTSQYASSDKEQSAAKDASYSYGAVELDDSGKGRTDISKVVYSKEVTETQSMTSITFQQHAFGLNRNEKWESVEPRLPMKTDGSVENVIVEQKDTSGLFNKWEQDVKESKEWIELKIQEMHPAMTDIGSNLQEATELYQQHEKVLEKLQTKQSPVEELLRQADDLISTQKPRGEVYSAMAENLGLAWKDLNAQLEQRRQILEQAVAFFSKADQFADSLDAVKRSAADTFLPETLESTASMLLRHKEERKMALSSSMRLLTEGQLLLERLCEVATHSMGDSRPQHMQHAARQTSSFVERHMEALQDRWRFLETMWAQKKIRLEQCQIKCQINMQLSEIQNWIRARGLEYLSQHNLGESSASSEILQHEHVKIENECKDKQEQCLKIVKTVEDLSHSGHYAAEELRDNAYLLLSECSDLITHLETRHYLLADSINFFNKAQTALNKLDQIEIQVSTSDVQHANLAVTTEDIANEAIRDGRQILTITGSHEPGAQGVSKKVDELERKKKIVLDLLRANESLASEKTLAFRKFCDSYEELIKWLRSNGEGFIQRSREMGTTQTSAKAFVDQHESLQNDLRMKTMQVEALLRTVPTLVHSGGVEAQEVHQMAETLRIQFTQLRTILEQRILIGQRYLSFLKLASKVSKEMDDLETLVKQAIQAPSPMSVRNIEEKQLSLRQEILQINNSGRNFLEDARKVEDSHLNMAQPCSTVEDILNRLESRNVTLTTQWLNYQNQISVTRDTLIQWEHLVKDSHRVIKCAKELEGKMFPVIPNELNRVESILPFLENRMAILLPQIKSVQKEMESFLKKSETLNLKEDPKPDGKQMLLELQKMNQIFQKKLTDYQILVSMMTSFFKNFEELEKLVYMQESQFSMTPLPSDHTKMEILIQDHTSIKPTVLELFKFSYTEAEQLIKKINEAEPALEAAQDREKICTIHSNRKEVFEKAWEEHRNRLEQHNQLCTFNRDMQMINQQIEDLRTQLSSIRENYGESLSSAIHTSEAFVNFEKTIELLQIRIHQFISTAERMMMEQKVDSSRVHQEIQNMQNKWSTFRTQVTNNRKLIDVAIEYYRTVEESEEWLKEGSRLLISVAKKSSACKNESDADSLRKEVQNFLNKGRGQQEERLRKISSLSLQLHGTHPQQTTHLVLNKNKDMMESFSVISTELTTLTTNIKLSHQVKEAEKKEKAEIDAVLHAAQAEAEAAKAAAIAAQEAAKIAEAAAKTIPVAATSAIQTRPPRFLKPLVDADVPEGTKYTFECHVEGEPVPQVQWFKDGILVQNNPDYQTTFENGICKLTIEETFSEDTARFNCKATNIAGYAETYCHLVVKESRSQNELIPPHFVQEPSDATVAEGKPYKLECQIFGNPLPLVTWFKDDVNIDYSTEYSITYNNGYCTLSVEEAALDHQGKYTCRAVNPVGQTACTANLQVCSTVPSEKPAFVAPLSNVMARAGQKLRLECSVTGQPEPEVTWLHNSKPIKETRDTKMHFDGRNATLIITEAFPKDAGTYTIIAKNKAGENVSSCNVSVKGRLPLETSDSEMASDIEPAKPQVKLHLEDQTVFEGNKVRMDCVIVGQPEPEVIWYHNGKPVKESDDFQLLFEGDRCTLIIKMAYLEDAGTYKCVAINSGGEASSLCQLIVQPVKEVEPRSQVSQKDILITVEKKEPPKFLKLLESITLLENTPLTLSCQISKDMGTKLTWFKDSHEIFSSADLQIHTQENGTSSLSIPAAQKQHCGTYSVIAQNPAGQAQSFCTVAVTQPTFAAFAQTPLVGTPPIFLKHIEDQRLFSGGNARFEAVVTGIPLPKVRWNFQGKAVPKDGNHETGFDDEKHWMTVKNVALSHVGRYSAVAENESGIATTSALLSIDDRSALPMDLGPQEQIAQSMVMMRKKTILQTSRISSMSEVSDVEVPESSTYSRFTTLDNLQDSQQVIQSSQTNLSTMAVSQMSSLPPKFLRPVSTAVVTEGEKLLLEATYEGSPEPKITWFKEDLELKTCPRLQISCSGGHTSMFIMKSLESDSGKYSCVASNPAGKATSIAEVRVKPYREAPKFVKRLQAGVVRSGSRVTFEVQVSGVPIPELKWFRNGNLLQNSPDFRISSSEYHHTLVINEVFPEDSGNFMAVANNPAGEARSMADLIVEEDKSPEEDKIISYQQYSSVEQKKEMFTKVSMSNSNYVEPYTFAQDMVKMAPQKEEPAKSPSPPLIPAIASQVWTQPKPEPFPAPAITETQEPILVLEPSLEEQHIETPKSIPAELIEIQHTLPELGKPTDEMPVTSAVSASFVKQSIMKFSQPDTKQQEVHTEDKKFRSFTKSQIKQPILQNGVDKGIRSTTSSVSSVTQSSFVSESKSFATSSVAKTEIFDVPKPVKFVPQAITTQVFSSQQEFQSTTPVWKPTGQESTIIQPTWRTVQPPTAIPLAQFPEIQPSLSKDIQSEISSVQEPIPSQLQSMIPEQPLIVQESPKISEAVPSIYSVESFSETASFTAEAPPTTGFPTFDTTLPVLSEISYDSSTQTTFSQASTTTGVQTTSSLASTATGVQTVPTTSSQASTTTGVQTASLQSSTTGVQTPSQASTTTGVQTLSPQASTATGVQTMSESTTKTRTSYSTEEISITKKYEVVVEEEKTTESSKQDASVDAQPSTAEVATQSPKVTPKPIIKKDTSDGPKPKKEVVIEEEPVVGAEVKTPQFSKVRGADSLRKIC